MTIHRESRRRDELAAGAAGNSVCSMETYLALPDRWVTEKLSHTEALREVKNLGNVLNKATTAVGHCYMRLCDVIRDYKLTDDEVRVALKDSFPKQRISELLRVANAPGEIYARWHTGFFGFKAALRECRYYNITKTDVLLDRQKRRAAERLVKLAGAGEVIEVCGHYVRIDLKPLNIEHMAEKLATE